MDTRRPLWMAACRVPKPSGSGPLKSATRRYCSAVAASRKRPIRGLGRGMSVMAIGPDTPW